MNTELDKVRKDIQNDNLEYLAEQYKAHRDYVTSYLISSKSCSRSNAEDIFSDAILLLRNKILLRELNNLTNIRSYLTGICLNMYRDDIRKRFRNKQNENKVRTTFRNNNIVGFHNELSDEVLSEIARNAIRRLGDRCAELLKLFYYERMPLKDIVELMNFSSVASVKSTKSVCFKKWVQEAKLLIQNHV